MYLPIAAGHAAHEAPRNVEQESLDELFGIAQEWLERWENKRGIWDDYVDAVTRVRNTIVPATTAGFLALHPRLQQHPEYSHLGTFISALWNKCCPETVIIYPHDTPELDWVGYCLSASKILAITGRTGQCAGACAKGVVSIQGTTGYLTGGDSRGPIIVTTTGRTGTSTAKYATGPLITLTPACISDYFSGDTITPEQYEQNGPLKRYVDKLLQLIEKDPDEIATIFGGGEQITKDIARLIDRKWWRVWRRTPRPREARR